jgi:hypothetical protein
MNCELMLTYDTPTYMFNENKNQLSRQTGSRNLTGPNTRPTIWHTYMYMKLVTKYQISAINNCWEKCDEIYFGRREGRWSGGINRAKRNEMIYKTLHRKLKIEHYRTLLKTQSGLWSWKLSMYITWEG